MKTIEEFTQIMERDRELFFQAEILYGKAKQVSDALEQEMERAEKSYEISKRNVDMYEEDSIENAEHGNDIEDEITTNNFSE